MNAKALSVCLEMKDVTEAGEFEGYGSVFGVLDKGGDIVMPGAFKESLSQHERNKTFPAMLMSHDPRTPIGEWLEIYEDGRGLYCKGQLWLGDKDAPADECALRAYRAMKSKSGMGLSIGYRTLTEEIDRTGGARRLMKVDLWEVSPTMFPMNPDARVSSAKSAESIVTIRDFEDFLRDVGGYSHAAAKAIASHGFKELPNPREEGGAAKGLIDAVASIRFPSNP